MVLLLFSSALIIPIVGDFFDDNPQSAWKFFQILLVNFLVCITLLITTHSQSKVTLDVRDTFILTVLIWLGCGLLAAFPFYYSINNCEFIDAFFESISTLTTTGFDIIPFEYKNDCLGLTLWGIVVQWFGGIGIIVTALTIFPFLRVGGLRLYRSEFSDRSEKILPKISQVAAFILTSYVFLSLLGVISLSIAGLSFWDAIYLAGACISTTGHTLHASHIELILNNPSVKIIMGVLMTLGGTTLIILVRLFKLQINFFFKDRQVRLYLSIILGSSLFITLAQMVRTHLFSPSFLIDAFFYTAGFISSSGFVLPGIIPAPPCILLLIIISFIGGCAGSTSGGIKIYRVDILYHVIVQYLKKMSLPKGFFQLIYNHQKITEQTAISVFCFVCLYIVFWIIISFALSLCGLDIKQSFITSLASLGNVGSGLHELTGCTLNIMELSVISKVLIIFGMLMGRLELISLLILLSPSFWKR